MGGGGNAPKDDESWTSGIREAFIVYPGCDLSFSRLTMHPTPHANRTKLMIRCWMTRTTLW